MAKKTEIKTEKIEREYIIPLREKCRAVPRHKRTVKAIRTIKEFLARHMKVRDRDLKKIKLDKYLNEFVWSRGIKNPIHKIKVKVIKEGEIVKAELAEVPDKIKFKKAREEKRETQAKQVGAKKKKAKEKLEEKIKEEKPETGKEKEEKEEKVKSVEKATKQIEKTAAIQMKHQSKQKTKEPKHQRRMALQK